MIPNYLPKGMSFTPAHDPLSNLQVPKTWENVSEFADWWQRAGQPLRFPLDPEVFCTDDATSICLFRQGRFQVELYLIHPNPIVPEHEHPGVEVIKMRLGMGKIPFMSNVLREGESHGTGTRIAAEDRGFPLVAFQHWLHRDPITVAVAWKGPTVGPKQEALIRKYNPGCLVIPGYADITRKMPEEIPEEKIKELVNA